MAEISDKIKSKSLYDTILSMYSNNNSSIDNVDSDNEFNSKVKKQIESRDEKYTSLLSHFVSVTKVRNIFKEVNKWLFFYVLMGVLIAFTVCIIGTINEIVDNAEAITDLIESIPLFITAITGFVSTIIAIPLAITKYLFSTEEDKYITDIISHTQQHDLDGRQWVGEFYKAKKAKSKSVPEEVSSEAQ